MSSFFKQHGWFLVVFLFYVYVTNPLNAQLPANIALGFDSHVYATVGWLWQDGYLPYRDIFDHKGLVVYLIDALGFAIWDKNLLGIYFFELIFLFFTLLFIFRTLLDNLLSVCVCLFILPTLYLMVFDGSEGGNMTEEYAALFAVLSVYLYASGRPLAVPLRLALYGVLGALSFLTKLNMALMPLVMFLMEVYRLRKVSAVMYCALGFLLILSSTSLYFHWRGGLSDFINTYFLFNLLFLDHSGLPLYQTIIPSFLYHPALFICLLVLLRLIYLHRPHRDFFFSVVLLVVCFFLAVGSGKLWNHYFLIYIGPLLFFVYLTKDALAEPLMTLRKSLGVLIPDLCKRYLTAPVLTAVLAVLLAFQYHDLLGRDEYSHELELLHSIGLNNNSRIAIKDAHLKPISIFYKLKAVPSQRMLYPIEVNEQTTDLPGVSHIINCIELQDFDFVITSKEKCLDESHFQLIGQYFGAGLYKKIPSANEAVSK